MDRRSTELSKVIRNTLEQTVCLELLPRSQVDVYVQVGVDVDQQRWQQWQQQQRQQQ
jgi:ribonuclease PH